jgi:deoxycytidylate deaminase
MDRDQGELATFGQDTRKLFLSSDFFICNDKRIEDVRESVERYLDLVFDVSIRTPTRAESAMYEAESASANSACMSRQVGASIVSRDGELIAVGWNDVPKYGGGLYSEDDRHVVDVATKAVENRDFRCHNWRGGVCHNDENRARLMDQVTDKIIAVPSLGAVVKSEVRDAVSKTDISAIIEFSRSIHAEMEAILSIAREGRNSLVGATLYTNTYPCHNCARHIVVSGIKNVIYIKPYKKSLALKLHDDAISEMVGDNDKVIFRQFDGVAPRNYLRMFTPTTERKKNGRLDRKPRTMALPIFRVALDSQRDYEDKVIADLAKKEQT